ncbi:MAG: XdhC family protein [Enterobacterales bacterium endosymbiont of Blomia tropicalis]|uniref:XdhC family protein n=1 Tax=Mixta mediterraneensis TaxID=2758443 RepID=UPI0025A908EF|nr:XdhC family protein [Mixta mediterraneensis]MDL4912520.1 XdhC family protein [Mixta mediterraneensis]
MITLDQRVIDSALRWLQSSQPVWLCTVLHTYGSSPRAPGTMMAINNQGDSCGSLSGGCIEEDFLQQLASGAYRNSSQIVRYGEGGLRPNVELPCGGSVDVLIEYLPVDTASAELLSAMHAALFGKHYLVKKLQPGQRAQWECFPADTVLPVLSHSQEEVVIPVGAIPQLLIAGYSVVAFECIRLALILGFKVTVCEHRASQLAEIEQQFGTDLNVCIVPQHPAKWLEQHKISSKMAILSLTHDPRIDELTMMEAVNTPAFYLGVMGSARNSAKRRQRLGDIGGLSDAELRRIQAPVGMKIGSKTPAEIALSVMADVVRAKNL